MTLPLSRTRTKRPVRSAKFQPMLLLNLASLSDMKSCWFGGQRVVRHQKQRWGNTYNGVVSHAIGLGPARHDKGIVEGDDDDQVNALGLNLVDGLGVGGNVGAGAERGESTGDGEKDDLLVLELCRRDNVSVMYAN